MADHNSRALSAAWWLATAVALYLVTPGHPTAGLSGLPLEPVSLAILVVVLLAAYVMRPRHWDRPAATRLAVAAAALVMLKGAVGIAAPEQGWRADYFANAELRPPVRVSTDFQHGAFTRIDRAVAFKDDTFPVHFFNENTFNRGIRREVSEPFSVRWTGTLAGVAGAPVVELTARGDATLSVNGHQVLAIEGARDPKSMSALLAVDPERPSALEVVYRKPPDTDGLIRLTVDRGEGATALGAPVVWPTPETAAAERSWLRPAGVAVHVAALALLLFAVMSWRTRETSVAPFGALPDRWIYAGLATLFVLQGAWKAWPLRHRFLSLSSGDDWLQYEAAAREILIGGPLMTFGKPFGQGEAFVYYPFYSYFLAFVHRLTGEDLFGVIVSQFVVLFFATVVIHRFSRRLFGPEAALMALGLLLAVEQMAFVRHYTVTLLAENLFFLTTAATVYALTCFVQTGRLLPLVAGGLLGGVSAITKPSIMLMLPPALVLVAIAGRRLGSSWSMTAGRVLAFGSAWAVVVSLTLMRNYIVSGEPILITTGQQWSFVLHNLPDSQLKEEYVWRLSNAGGGYGATAALLARLLWMYPVEFLSNVLVKIVFSLGMVHWLGSNVHPELLLLSTGYFISLIAFPAARQLAAWPAHIFIATHLVTMTLTMPSIYGYRLILPMYLFFASFTGLVAWRLWQRVTSRWLDGRGRRLTHPAHLGPH